MLTLGSQRDVHRATDGVCKLDACKPSLVLRRPWLREWLLKLCSRMDGNPDLKLPLGMLESLEQEEGGVSVQQLDILVKSLPHDEVVAFNRMVEQQLRESTKYAFLLPNDSGGEVGDTETLTMVNTKLKKLRAQQEGLQRLESLNASHRPSSRLLASTAASRAKEASGGSNGNSHPRQPGLLHELLAARRKARPSSCASGRSGSAPQVMMGGLEPEASATSSAAPLRSHPSASSLAPPDKGTGSASGHPSVSSATTSSGKQLDQVYRWVLDKWDKRALAATTIQLTWRAYRQRCERDGVQPEEPHAIASRRRAAALKKEIRVASRYVEYLKKQGRQLREEEEERRVTALAGEQALMDRLYRELKRLVASLPHVKIVAALAEAKGYIRKANSVIEPEPCTAQPPLRPHECNVPPSTTSSPLPTSLIRRSLSEGANLSLVAGAVGSSSTGHRAAAELPGNAGVDAAGDPQGPSAPRGTTPQASLLRCLSLSGVPSTQDEQVDGGPLTPAWASGSPITPQSPAQANFLRSASLRASRLAAFGLLGGGPPSDEASTSCLTSPKGSVTTSGVPSRPPSAIPGPRGTGPAPISPGPHRPAAPAVSITGWRAPGTAPPGASRRLAHSWSSPAASGYGSQAQRHHHQHHDRLLGTGLEDSLWSPPLGSTGGRVLHRDASMASVASYSSLMSASSISELDPADKIRWVLADMLHDERLHGVVRMPGAPGSPRQHKGATNVQKESDKMLKDLMFGRHKGGQGGMDMIETVICAKSPEEIACAVRAQVELLVSRRAVQVLQAAGTAPTTDVLETNTTTVIPAAASPPADSTPLDLSPWSHATPPPEAPALSGTAAYQGYAAGNTASNSSLTYAGHSGASLASGTNMIETICEGDQEGVDEQSVSSERTSHTDSGRTSGHHAGQGLAAPLDAAIAAGEEQVNGRRQAPGHAGVAAAGTAAGSQQDRGVGHEQEQLEDLVVGAVALGALLQRNSQLAGMHISDGGADLSCDDHVHIKATITPVSTAEKAGPLPAPPSPLINPFLASGQVLTQQCQDQEARGAQVMPLSSELTSVKGSPPACLDTATLTESVKEDSNASSIGSGSTPISPLLSPQSPIIPQLSETGTFGTGQGGPVGGLYGGDAPVSPAFSSAFEARPSMSYVLPVPAAVRDSFQAFRDEAESNRKSKAKQEEVDINALLEEEAHRLDSRLPSMGPDEASTTTTMMRSTHSYASLAGMSPPGGSPRSSLAGPPSILMAWGEGGGLDAPGQPPRMSSGGLFVNTWGPGTASEPGLSRAGSIAGAVAGGLPGTPLSRKASGLPPSTCFSPTPLSRATSATAAVLSVHTNEGGSACAIPEPRPGSLLESSSDKQVPLCFAGQIMTDTTPPVSPYQSGTRAPGEGGADSMPPAGPSGHRSYGLLQDPRFEQASQQGNWAAFLSDGPLNVKGDSPGSLSRRDSAIASILGGASPPPSLSGALKSLQHAHSAASITEAWAYPASDIESTSRRTGEGTTSTSYGVSTGAARPSTAVVVSPTADSPRVIHSQRSSTLTVNTAANTASAGATPLSPTTPSPPSAAAPEGGSGGGARARLLRQMSSRARSISGGGGVVTPNGSDPQPPPAKPAAAPPLSPQHSSSSGRQQSREALRGVLSVRPLTAQPLSRQASGAAPALSPTSSGPLTKAVMGAAASHLQGGRGANATPPRSREGSLHGGNSFLLAVGAGGGDDGCSSSREGSTHGGMAGAFLLRRLAASSSAALGARSSSDVQRMENGARSMLGKHASMGASEAAVAAAYAAGGIPALDASTRSTGRSRTGSHASVGAPYAGVPLLALNQGYMPRQSQGCTDNGGNPGIARPPNSDDSQSASYLTQQPGIRRRMAIYSSAGVPLSPSTSSMFSAGGHASISAGEVSITPTAPLSPASGQGGPMSSRRMVQPHQLASHASIPGAEQKATGPAVPVSPSSSAGADILGKRPVSALKLASQAPQRPHDHGPGLSGRSSAQMGWLQGATSASQTGLEQQPALPPPASVSEGGSGSGRGGRHSLVAKVQEARASGGGYFLIPAAMHGKHATQL